MLGRQSVVVKPLHEELEEMGLDPEKVKRDILQNSQGMPTATVNPLSLVEDVGTTVQPVGDDIEDSEVEEDDDSDDDFPEIDEDFEEDDIDEDEDGEELGEAFKVQKLRRLSSKEKSAGRKLRKKGKGKRKAYAKKYYARGKKKIAKRRKRMLKKYGAKGLAKLHKQRKRLVAGIDRLATLREELEDAGAPGTAVTSVEEAVINAGWLATLLGEIFESLGDADVAEMLDNISDAAAGLSEELEGVTEEDLSEDHQTALRQIFEAVAKAMEAHEDLGSPSLMESIEYGIENGLVEDDDDDDDDELEEELEDDSPFDELEESRVVKDPYGRSMQGVEYKDLQKGDILWSQHHGIVKKLNNKAALKPMGSKVSMKPGNVVVPQGTPGFDRLLKEFPKWKNDLQKLMD